MTERKRSERYARGFGRKRRKYQRDRYKYGAIYDSLMYSWIFMPARDVIAASQDESPIRRAEAARKVGSGIDIPWFMPRLSFSGVTTATSISFSFSLSLSLSLSLSPSHFFFFFSRLRFAEKSLVCLICNEITTDREIVRFFILMETIRDLIFFYNKYLQKDMIFSLAKIFSKSSHVRNTSIKRIHWYLSFV